MTKEKVKFFGSDENDDISSPENSAFTDYIIGMKTSNRFGAGTDANVYIQLCGENGKVTEPLILKHSQNVNKFERNQLDNFLFNNVISVSNVKLINVWHDNSGFGAAWHLEYVEISDIGSGLKFRFPCHRWFSTSEDDGKISRQLRCTEITEGPKLAVQLAVGVAKPMKPAALKIIMRGTSSDEPTFDPAPQPITPKQVVLVNAAKKIIVVFQFFVVQFVE